MSRRRQGRPPLMVRVWAALGSARITEEPQLRSDVKGEHVHGYIEGGHIWVSPTWSTVDTVVHELLHRMHPEWSEEYVRNRTSFLVNRMTQEEAETFYDEYRQRARRRKRAKRGVRQAGAGDQGPARIQEP